MTNEFKVGDKVKWVDPDSDSEMLFGEVSDCGSRHGFIPVTYNDAAGGGWMVLVKTADLHHAGDDLSYCVRYFSGDWDVNPIAPPEKKGYEPDGFDREAFDDFMRNLS